MRFLLKWIPRLLFAAATLLLVPGSQLHVLRGVGHIPQIESPAEFNAMLLKVLGTMPTTQGSPEGTKSR